MFCSASKNQLEYFGTKKAWKAYKDDLFNILDSMFTFAYSEGKNGMNWTQKQFAEKSHVSAQTLKRIYGKLQEGEDIDLKLGTAWKICYALGYSLTIKKGELYLKIRKAA